MANVKEINLTVNGISLRKTVEARKTLADFLRDDLDLTGTHLGCEHGVCGACTIMVDGKAVRSCLMLAVQADGSEIMTIEGLSAERNENDHVTQLHPLQNSFKENHALQCGFCTPGFLMTAYALLQEVSSPTEYQIRDAISGNICRCTGYSSIIEAIFQASKIIANE